MTRLFWDDRGRESIGPDQTSERPSRRSGRWHSRENFGNRGDDTGETGLLALSTTLGLAIEMSLHEEQERRALEGELSALETAWREAEEIGAIADGMFLPPGVEQALARLRRR